MKKIPFFALVAGLVTLGLSGCGNITTSPGTDPNRAITGTVNFRGDLVLPADAEVVVRLIDTSGGTVARAEMNKDLPIIDRPRAVVTPQVLGEQTIRSPGPGPVAFRIQYFADDSQLNHGLNLEARISYDGRVRFRSVTTRAVTPGNATDMHEVWVDAVSR